MYQINPQARHVKANSKKGADRIVAILEAALHTLTEKGYSGFTMRNIAKQAGISLGNITYYYKTKEAILHDMMDAVSEAYQGALDKIITDESLTDEDKMQKVLEQLILDLGEKETTLFFPEIWALSNHDAYVAENMDRIYSRARSLIARLIEKINPNLSKKSCQLLSLFISASIEGMTPFIGYKKEFSQARVTMANFASQQFVHLAQRLNDEEIEAQSLQELLETTP
ncbi:TetR/AcrR family transcriptional regulator [Hirschia baltica]|uniref:Transcriptional regulator, TetR family n=1 Tax=Hirschia baltica (strain ATCC 49814 / DSM 5838 / IFAM 1418) TaxID=582402 RepID=C6XQC0_HIRBI|nr:TetR/AcrR family transcriptional regulator [Hirschia baltica]ACT60419.1 transcriptional regulator, TetR family [Hirschia baltica ATCC 49814]